MSNTYHALIDNLSQLKLSKVKEYLPHYLDQVEQTKQSFIDVLKQLTDQEITFREERAAMINLHISNFPYHKSVDDFDFAYQPSLSQSQILELTTLRFLETYENILFIGSSGVGKTHLATAIGIEASKRHVSTYFIHFNTLMNRMKRAYAENRQEQIIKHYSKYRLLIIDEIGYLPVEKQYASMFFQLIANRYEKKSTLITTNLPLSKWGEVFNDATIATAIIDRLVHHSNIIRITGKSYRIKDKLPQDEKDSSPSPD
jgi:DNA replication protein DnaC